MNFAMQKGETADQREIIRKLVALQYKRKDSAFARGNFRVRGDNLEIFTSHFEDTAWRISFFGDEIEELTEFGPMTVRKVATLYYVKVFPNSLHVKQVPTLKQARETTTIALTAHLQELRARGRMLVAQPRE